MELLEASSQHTDIFCSALLILFSCYENTTPTEVGREGMLGGREEMEDYLGTMPPDQPNTFLPRRQPPGLLQCSDLCPVDPASDPAGCPAGHIWQPLSKASCWPSGEWQLRELTAGGLQVRGEELDQGVHLMVSALSGMF